VRTICVTQKFNSELYVRVGGLGNRIGLYARGRWGGLNFDYLLIKKKVSALGGLSGDGFGEVFWVETE